MVNKQCRLRSKRSSVTMVYIVLPFQLNLLVALLHCKTSHFVLMACSVTLFDVPFFASFVF